MTTAPRHPLAPSVPVQVAAHAAIKPHPQAAPQTQIQTQTQTRPGAGSGPGPLVVAGSRRSGTTWLAGMLNAHPEVVCRNEGWLFNPYGASLPDWLDEPRLRRFLSHAESAQWLGCFTPGELPRLLRRALWETVVRTAVEREGWKEWSRLRWVGDKTTQHPLVDADRVHDLFPDARFLVLVRDGRDVAVSDAFLLMRDLDALDLPERVRAAAHAAREHHLFGKGPPVPLFQSPVLRHVVGDWRAAVAGGRRAAELYGPACHEVRYEDLLARPRESLHAVLAWLGIERSDETIDHLLDLGRFERHSGGRPRGQADNAAEWRKGVAGDWKNHFTEDDKARFKAMAGELLVELGYERDLAW